MTPEDLQTALARALAMADTGFTSTCADAPEIEVSVPRRPELGDWTTTAALRAGSDPEHRRELAARICAHLRTYPEVAAATSYGPGFVNITLTPVARAQTAFDLVAADTTGTAHPTRGAASGDGAHRTPGAESAAALVSPTRLRMDAPAAADAVSALQLSHAACCRERRRAEAAGISIAGSDASTLDDPGEARLLNALAAVRGSLDRSHRLGDPAPVVDALRDVADAVEEWLRRCPVTPTIDEPITARHASRLVLVSAAIIVLAAGLRQLGASAPERI